MQQFFSTFTENRKNMEAIQSNFIELLKRSTATHISLAEELSELLKISLDSVYRRLRCETDITLSETFAICKHFNIPLEALAEINSNMVAFRINKLSNSAESFSQYLKVLHGDLNWMMKYPNHHLIYAAEDLPVFYHFFFPNLALFKMVYWNKSILNAESLQGKTIEEIQLPPTWLEEVPKVREVFLKIPTTEIWNDDTLKSSIQQIKFYWEAGFFQKKETILAILEDLDGILAMATKQAAMGKKYNPIKDQYYDVEYSMYGCELMIGNNTVFLTSDTHQASYIGYNSFNFMRSNNRYFNESNEGWLRNMISKSTPLSLVAEKSRNQFFRAIYNSIDKLRQQVLND